MQNPQRSLFHCLLALPVFVQAGLSASCQPEDDGGRDGYHSPGDSKWLRDKDAGVTIEYYRVFQQSNGTAYMMPRPDGNDDLFPVCTNALHPLRATIDRYGLCSAATSPEVVNAMAPADALAIARHLHEQLVFVPGIDQVTPFAPAEDLMALCNDDEEFRTKIVPEQCRFEREAKASGVRPSIALLFTPVQVMQTALRMNARYGIAPPRLCGRMERKAALTMTMTIAASDGPCNTNADCGIVGNESPCHDACSAAVLKTAIPDVSAIRQRLADGLCAQRAQSGCVEIVRPPCEPPGQPVCVQGRCLQM